MVPDSRNTRIVACLIASMTLGAGVLLWLEPPARGWSQGPLLLAEDGHTFQGVVIDYSRPGEPVVPDDYGCLVFPDGQCEWHPNSTLLRVLVVGSPDAALADAQARALLMLLGNVSHGRQDVASWVRLNPASDARLVSDLPPQARALTRLLTRKGIVR